MDHQLLSRGSLPWEGYEEVPPVVESEVDSFRVPWSPDWIVLRDRRFTDYPAVAGGEFRWEPRDHWASQTVRDYEETVLQGKVTGERYTVWALGYTPELAEELAKLVLSGKKSATCGSLASYEAEGEAVPEVGDLSVITDSKGVPRGVIRTTEAEVKPFKEVDARFAYDEGEGDRSYEFWRSAHESYFSQEAKAMGGSFSEEMLLVCERFELVGRFEEE